jgi:hypothetical protein
MFETLQNDVGRIGNPSIPFLEKPITLETISNQLTGAKRKQVELVVFPPFANVF